MLSPLYIHYLTIFFNIRLLASTPLTRRNKRIISSASNHTYCHLKSVSSLSLVDLARSRPSYDTILYQVCSQSKPINLGLPCPVLYIAIVMLWRVSSVVYV